MWTSWEERCGIASYTGALVQELQALGVTVDVVRVPYTDRDPRQAAAALERLNAADLVHLQHEYTFFGGIAPGSSSLPRYLVGLRRPYVITAHTVFSAAELLRVEHETRWRQRLAKQLLSALPTYRATVERAPFAGAAAVIVHTEAARERMVRRGIAPHRLHVLPAGIPAPAEPPPTPEPLAAMRDRFGLEGRRVVTVFGYVTPDKGYETALAALKGLPPAVKLLIAGGARVEREAPYLETLREEIRNRGLESRVAITGYLEEREIAAAMALTDLVLVPHKTANGSYSVMVALSYGKPVIASDLPCFREIRDEAGCIELFDVGDEGLLAERIGFLLASAGARRDLAACAAEYARARSWATVAQRTAEIYGGVVSG